MKIEPEDEKEFIKTEYLSGRGRYWIGRQMWPLRNYFRSFHPFKLNVCRMVELCIPMFSVFRS